MAKFLDLFDKEKRDLAEKVVNYYDGKSKPYLIKFLEMHRRNAINKGMVPRTRNLVKDIVDKSGMLFMGRPPTLEVWAITADIKDETATEAAQNVFEAADWVEFFNNFDSVVRMLKTAYVFVQFDPIKRKILLTALTPASCAVHKDETGDYDTLIYFTGNDGERDTYRVWSLTNVQDLYVSSSGDETLVPVTDNVLGLIPITAFNDVNTPRDGLENPIPEDLIEINDIVNLHMTDAAYAISHSMLQTLFTNAQIQQSGAGLGATTVVVTDYGSKLGPRVTSGGHSQSFVGGPGEAVAIDSGGESVFLDYKGPKPDVAAADAVIRGWIRDFARDWSVTVEDDTSGAGVADSGFKLVVKNMPNMELRKKRQRHMEAGFKALYQVFIRFSEVYGLGLSPNTELFVTFSPPELPVDEKSSEDVWSRKIKEGRSSDVEYFIAQQGLTRAEAEQKVIQLAKDRALLTRVNIDAGIGPIIDTPVVKTIVI